MQGYEGVYEKVREEVFRKALENVFGKETLQQSPSTKILLEELLNQIMKTEREIFLKGSPGNKANGYYPRTLSEGSFNLDISVPLTFYQNLTKGWTAVTLRCSIHW